MLLALWHVCSFERKFLDNFPKFLITFLRALPACPCTFHRTEDELGEFGKLDELGELGELGELDELDELGEFGE